MEFPGVLALDSVDFELLPGEAHVLLGENGAGKSTLMKVLSGVHTADKGDIALAGHSVRPASVLEAQRLGIVMVMQEFNLVPDLSVAENLILVNRPDRRLASFIDHAGMKREARKALDKIGIDIAPETLVRRLSVAEKQMVEIAKAMSLEARVLVLDEPTAALSDSEVKRLFELIKGLKEKGLGIVYISHRFEEIFEVGDRVTVLRDGKLVATHDLADVTGEELIKEMAGRELSDLYPRDCREPGEAVLEARNITAGEKVRDASFTLRTGEILGFGGLMGAGRTELAKAIFGAVEIEEGYLCLFGKKTDLRSPKKAMELGLAFSTEDRKEEGLFLDKSMAWNMSITDLKSVLSVGLISKEKEEQKAVGHIQKLSIRPPDPWRIAKTLSGGTQQKVVIAKWLGIRPRVLIMDEPTRGIDVGAKVDIYHLMDEFVAKGGAIILISSDLPELLAMSDRVLVMREGRIAGELCKGDFCQEKVLALATGIS